MSRIGIKPISIPEGVTVELTPTRATARGPLGELSLELPHTLSVKLTDGRLIVSRLNNIMLTRSLHGTIRSLIKNIISGVTDGFTKQLEMIGIGYRAAIEDKTLILQVGFTHPVRIDIPDSLAVKIDKNVISVTGIDKQEVGQFCAELRHVRPPEPYKGKGIRYYGEKVRMKQGKATKTGA